MSPGSRLCLGAQSPPRRSKTKNSSRRLTKPWEKILKVLRTKKKTMRKDKKSWSNTDPIQTSTSIDFSWNGWLNSTTSTFLCLASKQSSSFHSKRSMFKTEAFRRESIQTSEAVWQNQSWTQTSFWRSIRETACLTVNPLTSTVYKSMSSRALRMWATHKKTPPFF